MKQTRSSKRKSQANPPTIKIYTTADVVTEFTKRAKKENRSVSKHGEYLIKQDLATAS